MIARITAIKRNLHMDAIEAYLPESVPSARECPEFEEGLDVRSPLRQAGAPRRPLQARLENHRAQRRESLPWREIPVSTRVLVLSGRLRPVTFLVESVDDAER